LGGGKLEQAATATHNTTAAHISIERLMGDSFLRELRKGNGCRSNVRANTAASTGKNETGFRTRCSGPRVKDARTACEREYVTRLGTSNSGVCVKLLAKLMMQSVPRPTSR